MEPFLRKRGVHEDTLRGLRDQKIDEGAVRGMSDSDLSEYLPKKGDRFALKDFLGKGQEKPKARKASLMDRLRDRLRSRRDNSTDTCTDEDEPHSTAGKRQKLNAKKHIHKVHLGWYHFDEKKKIYLQVRAKAGGGKRTLMLNKNMNKHSIIKECFDLFFPNGKSQHGELKDMDVELTDFQLKPLENEETTLGDIIDRAKLQFIHFYLRTRSQNQIPDVDAHDDERQKDEEQDLNSSNISPVATTTSRDSNELNNEPSKFTEGSKREEHDLNPVISSISTIPSKVSEESTELKDKPVEIVEGDVPMDVGSSPDNFSLPGPLFFPVWEDSFEEVAFTHTEPIIKSCREPKEFEIVVHRGQVLRELIKIFKDNPDVDFSKDIISATIILPNGEREQAYDSGGVMRDLLTEFWDDFYEQCTTGTSLKVPCLRHDMEAEDWKAVARIIALGWILQKVLPIRLAPTFLTSSLFGMSSGKLREEFLQFIPQSESKVLSNALENKEKMEMDELLEILSNHECKVRVTSDNLGAVIDQIAHMEMVQEPAFIRECLFEVLITYELVMDVENEFQKITPTPKKLISCLECKESESDSFKYLKRYIREIDIDTKLLRNLLRYLTASDLMLYDSEGMFFKIQVKIVDLEGVARRPIAHTCGRVLDLPRMYESYPVFKSEMNAVLNSNIWVMDFA
ncbi:uncharacterized protein LOC117323154 [Pecten maximus]|uniref:uncharacterized protein LOC117323154 n=1 Tax=Pecten maximus TaxID=6579 RepID=UPI001458C49B|nr:uncharacterized protein LOC117323154 [Pecten maximus]